MQLSVQRINNEIVKPIPDKISEEDKKPVKGSNILPEIYCNVFALAKKKSGKSTLFYKMINDTCDSRTQVYAFVATLNKDKAWKNIKKLCDEKHIDFHGHTSIYDDNGSNILDDLVKSLEMEIQDDNDDEVKKKNKNNVIICDSDSDDDDELKKKKYKTRVPEYVIILDDLSTELNSPSISALLKKNRHFLSKILIGNQYWNDLLKSGRKNLDYMMIFGHQPKDKLQEIHKELDLSISFDQFHELYKYATKDRFCFLYIDVVNEQFRKNFNMKLTIT
jgi:hypothetical protein